MKNNTILITGGTGLIGSHLSDMLSKKGYEIRHLSRSTSPQAKYPTFKWDVDQQYIDPKALENVDYIIHLAGENVSSGRWTEARKKRILKSRTATAELLKNELEKQNTQLRAFISASGISYYGSITSSQIFSENDAAGNDFLAQVSVAWENATQSLVACASRVVSLRTGVVLSTEGGALAKLIKPIKWGVGSPLGSGKQYMPWLHLDDICRMYIHAIETPIEGVYNAVSDEHVTNAEMTKRIADICNKPTWLPNVPAFAIKLLFGEMAVIVLKGSRIDNAKIKSTGFEFKYTKLIPALEDLIKH